MQLAMYRCMSLMARDAGPSKMIVRAIIESNDHRKDEAILEVCLSAQTFLRARALCGPMMTRASGEHVSRPRGAATSQDELISRLVGAH